MNTLKICISRIVSRFYKCLKACLHKSAHTAAKNRLFAEKVCLCLCTECSLEDTGSCSSDRKTICESFIKSNDAIAIFSNAFTFALLIVVLLFKPTGMFGEAQSEKV